MSVVTENKFEKKIESSSAKMYFHYYGQLLHQQNMMQDYVRTGDFLKFYISLFLFNYLFFNFLCCMSECNSIMIILFFFSRHPIWYMK